MKAALRFLDRMLGGPAVVPVTAREMPGCVQMALDNYAEYGLPTWNGTRARIGKHLAGLQVLPRGTCLVAVRGEAILGMICCAMGDPDVWDDRPVATVWFLYVKPEYRRSPRVALALMRAALATGLAWGAQQFRVTIDARSQDTIQRYERRLGFRKELTHHTYSLRF